MIQNIDIVLIPLRQVMWLLLVSVLSTSLPLDKMEKDCSTFITKVSDSLNVVGRVGNGLTSCQASTSVPTSIKKASVAKIPLE